MKKLITLSLAAILSLALTACTGGGSKPSSTQPASAPVQEAKKEEKKKWPDKPINLIISYAAGGDTDAGARILMPYVEKELGVAINVINKPGGGGWIGWTDLANAKPDGYTIGYLNVPNLMTGYLDPKQKRKDNLESFTPIANHITDPGIIAIRKDEKRFSDIKSLMEYAKSHELTMTSNGVGSDEHYVSLMLNKQYGTKFTPVQDKGVAESQANVLGGHVDLLFANVGGAAALHKSGEIKILGVMSDQRSPFLSEVPTLKESGFEIVSGSSRGIAAPKGVDPDKLEILRAALEKGIRNEEQVKKQGETGLQVDYKDGQDYVNLLKKYEQDVLGLRDLLGW